MRIGIAVTRAASMDHTWTTLHLAQAALRRGHAVRFIEPADYEIHEDGEVLVRGSCFDEPALPAAMAEALQSRTAPRRIAPIEHLDLLLLRAAPVDTAVLTFAAIARARGVPVVNDPAGALAVGHKGWLASIPGLPTPPTVVTRRTGLAFEFFASQPHGVVVKPARGSGGRGVSFIAPGERDRLDPALEEAAAQGGDRYVVLQAYLPAAARGEKRLVWLDGEVLGGYLRERAPGDFRHNLKRGGQAVPTDITEAERAAVARLSPVLLGGGVRIAGLDLIDGLVTEVNALNPGGAYHVDRLTGSDLAGTIIDRLLGHAHTPPLGRTPWAPIAP
jgi:glutathione synthase